MGIDDRDYMRDRYRQRQGLGSGRTEWNDKKGREQLRDGSKKAVPLGSAGWVGGSWFDEVNRGQDYQRKRYRSRRPKSKNRNVIKSFLVEVVLRLGIVVIVPYAMYRLYIATMIPAFQALVPVPFPDNGSVYVTSQTDIERRQGLIRFKAPDAPANSYVVMLHDINRGHDTLGVFVAGSRKTKTPVPVGTYRVRIAQGRPETWRGLDKLFGTTEARELMRPLTIVQATDKTVDLATPLSQALKIERNTNLGFVDP